MEIGITVRNMGPQSSQAMLAACAAHAEDVGLSSIWVTDHIAIPPDDAEGSGGRYLDTMTTLAWLAGRTDKIRVGAGVLILPYRPPLPTAKQIATVQELSNGRLLMGVGVGWMQAEFQALGVPITERGQRTDDTLAFIRDCFAGDEVVANGQRFLFLPRPDRPPILIGGRGAHAWRRVAQYGDGWLPMVGSPEKLAAQIPGFREVAGDAALLWAMGGLPLGDSDAAGALLAEYAALGVSHFICGARYDTVEQFKQQADALVALLD